MQLQSEEQKGDDDGSGREGTWARDREEVLDPD